MSAARRAGLLATAALLAVPVALSATGPAEAAPKPTLRVFDATLSEGTGGQAVVAFAVQLSAPATKKLSFTWGTRTGTATVGQDYTAVAAGTAASIAKGQTSTALVVRVAADVVDEYTETFGVRLAAVPSWVTLGDADATATILDDDAAPRLSVTPAQVVEGDPGSTPTRRTLTATLSQPSGKPASVRYAVAAGTAALGTDLASRSATLTFAPGATTATVAVDVFGDTDDEPNRTFSLAWSGPTNLQLPGRRTVVSLLDDDGPLRPSILGTTPVSPSSDPTPLVYGLAPGGSTVLVYLNGSCSGTPAASGPAAGFTGAGIAVPVTPNRSNTLTVKATDTVGGDDTDCSVPFSAYVHDDTAPDAPTNLRLTPTSPTQEPEPVVHGSAEAGSQVAVYVDAACTGLPIATLSASAFAGAGLTLLGLTANVTHSVRASATDAAGNVSDCSAPLSVLVDTQGPAAPSGVHVVSGLPSGQNVVVGGTAEAGSTVQLFVDQACTGSVDGSGSAAVFGAAGVGLDQDLNDGAHTIYARAVDQAGNQGTCSGGLDVDVDGTAPGAPTGLVLVGESPTDQTSAQVRGSADAGTTVRLYVDTNGGGASCNVLVGSGSAASFEDADGLTASGLDEGSNEIHATSVDDAGNESACSTSSVTVVVDTDPPAAPVALQAPGGSPTNDSTPTITGNAESGTQIHLFLDDSDCSGTNVGTATAAVFENAGIDLSDALADGTYQITATATDTAGNESDCSAPVTVTVDLTPPAAPVLAAVDYAASPFATGTALGAERVHVYLDSDCSGAPHVSGTAAAFGGSGLALGPLATATYDLSATSEDDAGNVSGCSASISFAVP